MHLFLVFLLLIVNSSVSFAQSIAHGDDCSSYSAGDLTFSGGASDAGQGRFLVCNGTTWVQTYMFGTNGIFVPRYANNDACVDGDTLVYDAATGGMSCSGSAPTGCDNVGDTCSDGTIYAGLTPDGNVPMYTMPADSGQHTWNNEGVETGMGYCWADPNVCVQGQNNTAYLEADGGDFQAARTCFELSAYGHNDWYLPAKEEMELLQANSGIGDLSGSFSGTYYWTSSEQWNSNAYYVSITDGSGGDGDYTFTNWVRCTRKGT